MSPELLQDILQRISLAFPRTFARLAHWHLIFHDNTMLLDPQTVILAILPLCLFYIECVATINRHRHEDRDDEQPPQRLPGYFRVLHGNIRYWHFVYTALELVAAVDIVLRTSGLCAKALLVIDLAVESSLVSLARIIFLLSVGLFVSVAFDGFDGFLFLGGFFISVWMSLQLA